MESAAAFRDAGSASPAAHFGRPFVPPEILTRQRAASAWRAGYRLSLTATDAIVIGLSLAFAQAVHIGVSDLEGRQAGSGYSWMSLAIALLWLGSLVAIRSTAIRHVGAGNIEYQRVATGTFAAFGLVAVIALLLKVGIARSYLLVALPIGLIALLSAAPYGVRGCAPAAGRAPAPRMRSSSAAVGCEPHHRAADQTSPRRVPADRGGLH